MTQFIVERSARVERRHVWTTFLVLLAVASALALAVGVRGAAAANTDCSGVTSTNLLNHSGGHMTMVDTAGRFLTPDADGRIAKWIISTGTVVFTKVSSGMVGSSSTETVGTNTIVLTGTSGLFYYHFASGYCHIQATAN